MKTVVCATCGTSFERYNMNKTRMSKPQFCSQDCYSSGMRARADARIEGRILARIDKRGPSECWEWRGRRTKMITLTERAAERVRRHLQHRGHGLGIRLGVKTTGCSGLGYVLEYVDQASALRPMTFDSHGVTIFVDSKDMVYLDGMTLDWKREGLQEGFDFINPNEAARCGCGESFKI